MNTSERALEAAAVASYMFTEGASAMEWSLESQSHRDAYLDDARIQLEAASPIIAAQALREVADELDSMKREAWQFDLAASPHWLRMRADQLETDA